MQTTNRLFDEILALRDESQVSQLMRFFKTEKGGYGENDKFLGIRVPAVRSVVGKCWRDVTFEQLEECITSEFHEMRLSALLTLIKIYNENKKNVERQKACIDFYLSHLEYVNNWDLVDLSCYELLGSWLLDKDREVLYDFARNGKTIWERRIGIVSTMKFVRNGELDDTFSISDIFLEDKEPLHDLLQKAVGWLLREAGKRDVERLKCWLEPRRTTMPRTMLRYSIEKFSPEERLYFLSKS